MAIRSMIASSLSTSVGKYFNIKNKATGDLLNVKEGLTDPGTTVNLWKKNGSANQIFFSDPLTGTIRGKQSQLCLEINGDNRLVINPYNEASTNQKWRFNVDKGTIENARNSVMVLDALGKTAGADVGAQELKTNTSSQIWILVPLPIEYFTIRSALAPDKAINISGRKTGSGVKLILWDSVKSKPAENEIWYEDCMGNVRSKFSDKIIMDGSKHVVMTGEYKEGKEKLFWVICGNKLVNRDNWNEVIEVKDNMTVDGAELRVAEYRGLDNQHWSIEYV